MAYRRGIQKVSFSAKKIRHFIKVLFRTRPDLTETKSPRVGSHFPEVIPLDGIQVFNGCMIKVPGYQPLLFKNLMGDKLCFGQPDLIGR
jgi:hypothetical protein